MTTNSAEGFVGVFKKGMKGVYQHCSEKHLNRYVTEFGFRHNTRALLGINDGERTDLAIIGSIGKRLTYRQTDQAYVWVSGLASGEDASEEAFRFLGLIFGCGGVASIRLITSSRRFSTAASDTQNSYAMRGTPTI